jgi:asparagine N-glycosylation enzyme membrane subunit Stt3
MTFIFALKVARKAEEARIASGVIVGVLAGLLSSAITLAFGGRMGLHNSLFVLAVAALGWFGGFIGEKTANAKSRNAPH